MTTRRRLLVWLTFALAGAALVGLWLAAAGVRPCDSLSALPWLACR